MLSLFRCYKYGVFVLIEYLVFCELIGWYKIRWIDIKNLKMWLILWYLKLKLYKLFVFVKIRSDLVWFYYKMD